MDRTYSLHSLPANPARALATSYPVRVLFFLLIHIPIGLLVRSSTTLATLHALVLPALGVFFLLRDHEPRRLCNVVGYMVGAETLWRLRTALNYEYDKYAIGILLILGLLKYGRDRKLDWLPALYFALLLPAIFYMPAFDREVVAFNLAGPVLLGIAAIFFSMIKIDQSQLRGFLLSTLAPILGVAAIAAFSTITTEEIVFTGGTNPITSGGDGGNQISAIMGLGAVIALTLAALLRGHRFLQFFMIGCTIDLLAQSAFTFARGGFFTALGAITIFSFYLLRDHRQRVILLLGIPIVLLVNVYLVFPMLNTFSNGVFFQRLQDSDTTGRDAIAFQDLELFQENPMQGVGLGESVYAHAEVFRITQPHTEATRMLAEHGLPGLLALLIWLWLMARRILRPAPPTMKIFAVTFLAWSFATTLHVAMRLAAPAVLFGLGALVQFTQEQPAAQELPAPAEAPETTNA
ncbi:MAG: O-antigen ligase family protein [Chloroflexi bacterium]|nr:O-antigen ligase family protein [Chloroflexota bacterium]MCI0645907.1 O-antigen ligase family protein [Chloroflexota bacterium]MCI0725762.1 O-antigen ligase family protein [Chloroflexota bacterium]